MKDRFVEWIRIVLLTDFLNSAVFIFTFLGFLLVLWLMFSLLVLSTYVGGLIFVAFAVVSIFFHFRMIHLIVFPEVYKSRYTFQLVYIAPQLHRWHIWGALGLHEVVCLEFTLTNLLNNKVYSNVDCRIKHHNTFYIILFTRNATLFTNHATSEENWWNCILLTVFTVKWKLNTYVLSIFRAFTCNKFRNIQYSPSTWKWIGSLHNVVVTWKNVRKTGSWIIIPGTVHMHTVFYYGHITLKFRFPYDFGVKQSRAWSVYRWVTASEYQVF